MKLEKISPKSIFFISSTIVFLSYLKPIFTVWAYSDEYDFFEVTPKLGNHMAQDGNLISAFLYSNFSAPLINSAEDLWRLRVLSFLALFLILNHLSNQILTYNKSRSTQFFLPIALTLPAPMTYISWSLIWQGSFAMLIAYLANILWLKSGLGMKLISFVLLSCSILMSPVAAFSIFGFHAIVFVLARVKSLDFLKIALKILALYGISGIASILTLIVSTSFLGTKLNERVGPPNLSELPEKVYWIISRPIVVSMRFFDISSPTQINAIFTSLVVSSLLICGFLVQSKNLRENIFFRLILFSTLILLSITPIVITWSNQIEYRYILGPSVAIFVVALALAKEVIGGRKFILKYAYFPSIVLVSFFGVVTMNNHVNNQFIEPYKSKTAFIQSELSKCKNKIHTLEEVVILQPKSTYPSWNNIGIFSQSTDMASPWVPIPSVKYVLKTLEMFSNQITLQNSDADTPLNSCKVDLEKYSRQLEVSDISSP
jgi:hypothetical protein